MTPHGPSTSSTRRIPPAPDPAPDPYRALAAPDADRLPPPPAAPSPYQQLGSPLDFALRPDEGTAPTAPLPETPAAPDALDALADLNEPKTRGHRGARRPTGIRRALRTAVALTVLLAFLAVGDRWAVLYADGKAAKKVEQALKLHAAPEVHIDGFPFLTQVAASRLDHVEVTIPDMSAGRVSVAQVKGSVNDVRIVGGDTPTAIKGAVLGRMRGEVLLDFDDLDRELGTSQVDFSAGGPSTVLAAGKLPIAGRQVSVHARAHLRRTGDRGVGTTVDDMRLDVPGLFSYLPGPNGGLRLARPMAERIQHDAAKAKALFQVSAIAKRFGLTPERAALVRKSEAELHKLTGAPYFVDKLMRINLLDLALAHPELLEHFGVSPALVDGLEHLHIPQLADRLSVSTQLPQVPGNVRLRGISVAKDGIKARLTGVDVPFGHPGTGPQFAPGPHAPELAPRPRQP